MSPVKGQPGNPAFGSKYPCEAPCGKQEAAVKTGNRFGLNYCNPSFYLEAGMDPSSTAGCLLPFCALIILPFHWGGAFPSPEGFRLELLPLSALRNWGLTGPFVFSPALGWKTA